MSLKLYGYWRSSASYRVRIALNLKQLDYQYIPIDLVNNGGDQRSEDYQRLNPSRLVPTLVDDDADVTLSQSLAIIEYLDEKYDEHCRLLPEHAQDRARVRMLSHDIASDTQPLVNLRVVNALKDDFAASEKQTTDWVQNWIRRGFEGVSSKIDKRAGKYAYGYQLTMLDICLIPQVYSANRFGLNMQDFPLINKIYHNCMEMEAFQKAAPENQVDAP